VRSTELDDWAFEDIAKMIVGGNHRAKLFFKSNGITDEMEGSDKYVSKAGERYRDDLMDILRKNEEFMSTLKGGTIEKILLWVDKFDSTPKQKEQLQPLQNAPKVLGTKSETNKKIGVVKNISNDFFSNFDDPSEESEEEVVPENKTENNNNFSRLGYKPQENKKNEPKDDNPKKMNKSTRTAIINLMTKRIQKIKDDVMIVMMINEMIEKMIDEMIEMINEMIERINEMIIDIIKAMTLEEDIMIHMTGEIMKKKEEGIINETIMEEDIMIIHMTEEMIEMIEMTDDMKKKRKMFHLIQKSIAIPNQYPLTNYLAMMTKKRNLLMVIE